MTPTWKAYLIWLGTLAAGCNWTPPTSEEGLVDTLQSEDAFLAKDSLAVTDSLLVDSARKDNLVLADTSRVPGPRGIETKGLDREELMRFAETLIGVPYKYASTDPKVGFDCSGFITYVFNHFNVEVPRSSIDFTHVGQEIPEASARRGDIILFTGTDSTERHVGHMGLIVSNDRSGLKFIHSTSGKARGVTITPLNDYYRGRFVKTIRILE